MPTTVVRSSAAWILAVLLLAGCGDAEDSLGEAVDQAQDTVQLVEFCTSAAETVSAVNDEDLDAAMNAAESMVAEAPDEIADQAEAVFEGVEAARQGDQEAVQTEEFRTAATELERYTRENCDPSN